MNTKHYNVWVNGEKINAYPLSAEQATTVANIWNINSYGGGAKVIPAWTI